MTNNIPDPAPRRFARPMPSAADFKPVVIGSADRSRNGRRTPRSVTHRGLR